MCSCCDWIIAATDYYIPFSIIIPFPLTAFLHDIAHIHLPTNVSTKYPIALRYKFQSYSLHRILMVKLTLARSNQGHTMPLYTCTPPPPHTHTHTLTHLPKQSSCQVSTFYTSQFLRNSPDKILNVKITVATCHWQRQSSS